MPRAVKYRIILEDKYTRTALKVAATSQSLKKKFRKLSFSVKEVGKALRKTESGMRSFGRTMMKVGKNASFLGGKLGGMIARLGPAALMFKALKTAGENTMMEKSFGVLTGSKEIGKKLNEDLMQFAATTPFTIPKVQKTAKTLLAYGIDNDNILDTVRMIGEISSGTGADIGRIALAVGQVKSTGFLQGQDARQLEAAGVGIRRLVKEKVQKVHGVDLPMGDVMRAVSDRMIPAEFILDILKDMTKEGGRFYRIMQELNATLPGQFTNFLDNLIRIGIIFGNSLDKTFKITELLTWANTLITDFLKKFQENPEQFESIMRIISILSAFTIILPFIIAFVGGLTFAFSMLTTAATALSISLLPLILWPTLIFAIGLAVWYLIANFDKLKEIAGGAIEWIKKKWDGLIDGIWAAESLTVLGLIRDGGAALGLWNDRNHKNTFNGEIYIHDPGNMVERYNSWSTEDLFFETGQNMSPRDGH